ncbi:OmpA family protein [Capnocytophaga sp. ARDL2]|uniref:OmpA family protein n=1 Tax=Capnocytophaga sp. ARDL2 TaxID=3238809 RepID=UPI0035584EB9
MKKVGISLLVGSMVLGSVMTSCNAVKNSDNTQRGATVGAAAGAILGGVVGNNVKNKNSALGAVLGGVVGGTAGAIIGRKMDKQAQDIQATLPGAEVERVGEGIRVVLKENTVNFGFDSSDLTSTAQSNLKKISKVFIDNHQTEVMIYGYTDSVGKDEYNVKLSQRRADAVKKYLVSQGIGTKRINTKGMGAADPVASNDTAEGRAQNRRVEFAIVANDDMIEAARKEANSY